MVAAPVDGTRGPGEKTDYIFHGSVEPGIVFYGPYWRLPEGNYEAIFVLEPLAEHSASATVHPRWDETRHSHESSMETLS